MQQQNSGTDRQESKSRTPLWLRWWGLGWGAIFLIWLPLEDVSVNYVLGLAVGVSGWLAARQTTLNWERMNRKKLLLAGGLGGLIVPLMAIILIVFKAGIHAHGFLDFANVQIFEVIQSTPWWVLAGVLAGGFAALLGKKT